MPFLFIGCLCSKAHTLSLHVLPARCMEHVTAWKSTHKLVMLELCLADGALIVVSFIPDEVVGLGACLRGILLRLRC